MSETRKRRKNPAIACCNMIAGKEIVVNQGKFGPSQNDINNLAGMEIKVEGYQIIVNESGKVLRVKDKRTISEVVDDRRRAKIKDAMKSKEGGIEH